MQLRERCWVSRLDFEFNFRAISMNQQRSTISLSSFSNDARWIAPMISTRAGRLERWEKFEGSFLKDRFFRRRELPALPIAKISPMFYFDLTLGTEPVKGAQKLCFLIVSRKCVSSWKEAL
jgi:hypothetical protein